MRIPPETYWKQTNRGDSVGSMWGSFNIDLQSNLGKVRPTRMLQNESQAVNTDLSGPAVKFVTFQDNAAIKIWTLAGSRVHSASGSPPTPMSSFTVDAATGTPTNVSIDDDIEVFNGALYATGGSSLYKYTPGGGSGTWAANGTGITTGVPKNMTVFEDRLYITRGAQTKGIISMNTSDVIATSGSNTLTIPTEHTPTWIRVASGRLWIGTINTRGGKGRVYEWDGASETATRFYTIDAQGALACVVKDDRPWIMDSNGRLLAFNVSGFQEIARLPADGKLLKNSTSTTNTRFIHPNGMAVIEDRINIVINNQFADSTSSIKENLPSGVWEYDENIGLYHKYSFSYRGRPDTSATGLTDYGQNRVSAVGGISPVKSTNTSAFNTGTFLVGATLFSNASSTEAGIYTNDLYETVNGTHSTTAATTTQACGYIITPKIYSKEIRDAWQKITARYKPLNITDDRIEIKYRTSEEVPTEASITWTSTTTFTTTTNVLGLENYECEIIQGKGSGAMQKVVRIDREGSNYIVTLENAVLGVTGTAKARFQNWKSVGTVSDITSNTETFTIGAIAPWIQFKIILKLTRGEFDDILLTNVNHELAK